MKHREHVEQRDALPGPRTAADPKQTELSARFTATAHFLDPVLRLIYKLVKYRSIRETSLSEMAHIRSISDQNLTWFHRSWRLIFAGP